MKIIKGASGFGDALYLRVIVEWLLLNKPNSYTVLTNYPEVYKDLPIETDILHSQKYNSIDYYCHYLHGKTLHTTQWEDMLNRAKLPYFPLTSQLENRKQYNSNDHEQIVLIAPYNSMNGAKGTKPMIPRFKEIIDYVSQYNNVIFINKKYKFLDLIKLFNQSSLIIGQVGWCVPLAEMLNIPLHAIFTKRALNSEYKFISQITPEKLLTKHTSKAIIME